MDEGFFFGQLFFFIAESEGNFGRMNNFEFQHRTFFEKSKFFKSLRPSGALCH